VDERESTSGVHGLPIDSDLVADEARRPLKPPSSKRTGLAGAEKPAHLRWFLIALVAVGGAVGTAAREALTLAFPVQTSATDGAIGAIPPGLPLTVGAINVGGGFVLGILLAALAARGPDVGRRRTLRVTFGTGVLGGFTTYSALAADTAGLLTSGSPGQQLTGAAYAVASIVIGGAASALGMWVGGRGARLSDTRTAGNPTPQAGNRTRGSRPTTRSESAGDS
jgi:CrcB protein